jgi:iron complex transport system permease protein
MKPRAIWIVLLLAGCLTIIGISLLLGAEWISPLQAWQEWRSGDSLSDSPALSILMYQRLPRTLAAFLAGAGLALAGAVFQALLRNPLATPYTLGIASTSALGAWLAFILLDAGLLAHRLIGIPTVQAFALAFALGDVLLVYILAARRKSSPTVLLLAGVTLGMLANSGIMLTRYLAAPERLVTMDRWLMGGVDVLGYWPVLVLLAGVLPCAVILLALAAQYDQFGFSEELAAGRGIQVARLQLITFLIGSLMTAIIVSEVGPIGFVGLIVPHAVRAFTGPGHRRLLPVTLIAGGAFLCCCDIVARKILPGETPIGIITTLIGGPFFLYLLMRRRFTNWT